MFKSRKYLLIVFLIVIFSFSLHSCFRKQPSKITSPDDSQMPLENHVKKSNPINPGSLEENPDEAAENIEDIDPDTLSNNKIGFGLGPIVDHSIPGIPASMKAMFDKYSGYYVGDTSSRVIYLTFDEGYENGYSGKILDILKENNIPAAFFVTKPYITSNPDLIKRMESEGHIVGNHTSKHPSMPSRANDIEAFNREFTDTENAYREVTGKDMPKFFRPPMGEFSERTLYLTQKLGYKSIFWSFAHVDWDVNNQPSVDGTLKKVISKSHNGEIMLLHAVSKSNTEALDTIIKQLKSDGYRFASLNELK